MTPACSPESATSRSPVRQFSPALTSVSFCSCYIYSPRGDGFTSEASRQLCARLKLGDLAWLPHYAGVVREQASKHHWLADMFAPDVTFVPVPGSNPSAARVWAAERLAFALQGVRLGGSVWPGLQRRFAVRKSATALNADRPTFQQHCASFSVHAPSEAPRRIVLVDDVITKGRTILAAAAKLQEALPNADIRAFALVRTMGFLPHVTHFLEPCQGVVRWAGGDARRDP